MNTQRSLTEYKAEMSRYLDAFARSLSTQIDAPAISRVKLAGNAVWCREALLWRFTELVQDALERLGHLLLHGDHLTTGPKRTA